MIFIEHYRSKQKDSLLKGIKKEYTAVYKNGMGDYEWEILVSLMKDIRKDGFIRGNINRDDDKLDVFLTDSGRLFLDNGGYKRTYYNSMWSDYRKYIIPVITGILGYFLGKII